MEEKFVIQIYLGENTDIAKMVLDRAGAVIREEFIGYGHFGPYFIRDDYLRCELLKGGVGLKELRQRMRRAEFQGQRRIADFDLLQEHSSFETCTRFNPGVSRIRKTVPDRGETIPVQNKILFK